MTHCIPTRKNMSCRFGTVHMAVPAFLTVVIQAHNASTLELMIFGNLFAAAMSFLVTAVRMGVPAICMV